MELAITILILFISVQHFGFMVLEMFLWKKPAGMKIFRTKKDFAAESAPLAMNQGLYNGFLAAGLALSFFLPADGVNAARLFVLTCVAAAGVFGAFTVSRRIFFIQAAPALAAIVLVLSR